MAIHGVAELLRTIERLPAAERRRARARVEEAVGMPAAAARAHLGLLALELADAPQDPAGGARPAPADDLLVVPEAAAAGRGR